MEILIEGYSNPVPQKKHWYSNWIPNWAFWSQTGYYLFWICATAKRYEIHGRDWLYHMNTAMKVHQNQLTSCGIESIAHFKRNGWYRLSKMEGFLLKFTTLFRCEHWVPEIFIHGNAWAAVLVWWKNTPKFQHDQRHLALKAWGRLLECFCFGLIIATCATCQTTLSADLEAGLK